MGRILTPSCRGFFVVAAAASVVVWPVNSHSQMRDTAPAPSKNTLSLYVLSFFLFYITCWAAPSSSSGSGSGGAPLALNYRVDSPALFSLAFAFLFKSIRFTDKLCLFFICEGTFIAV